LINKYLFIWVQSLVALAVVSCGGGGSVTELGGLSVQFTPEEAAPAPNSVSLQDGGVLDDVATVDVQADAIALLAFRTSFTLRFDPAVIEFVGWEPGDFFEQRTTPANVTYTILPPAVGSDRLDVEIVKSGTLAGSFEDGVLVKLQWRAIAAGASTLLFDSPRLADANNIGAQNVSWFGGRLDGF
jgi:hypothetical protein